MTERDHFWAKVDKNGPLHPTLGTQCWVWTAARDTKGYGRFGFRGRNDRAHRVIYAIHTGQLVPREVLVCHHCDNPPCVRPSHHFWGDNSRNQLDSGAKGRHQRQVHRITVCKHGHPYTEENTIHNKTNGARSCRECSRIRDRARYAANPFKRGRAA